jgi:hypothetical protein
MKEIKVIFISPVHDNFMDKVGNLGKGTTGSRWAHVAGYLLGGIFEALMPEVTISPIDKYDEDTTKEILTIKVTNREYASIENAARNMLGNDVKYGIRDCIVGGICSIFGRKAAWVISKLLMTDKDNTLDCSGVWSTLLLEVPEFKEHMATMGWYANNISWIVPQDLYSIIKSYKNPK